MTGTSYRVALRRSVAASAFAWLAVSAGETVLAGGGGELFGLVLGLYALPALAVGVALGLVTGAAQNTFGATPLRNAHAALRQRDELDTRWAAIALAGAATAPFFVLFVQQLSIRLVGVPVRKSIGGILLGASLLIALPAFFGVGLVWFRVMRRLAGKLPRLFALPRTLVLLLASILATASFGLAYVFLRLDWRGLDFGPYLAAMAFALAMLLWFGLWKLPLRGLGERMPARGWFALVAAVLAVLLPFQTLRGTPSRTAVTTLSENTYGARALLGAARGLIDADADGFSSFLSGPDCNDADAAVFPRADEIPGNGIDEDCDGQDPKPLATPNTADLAVSKQASALGFQGNLLFILVDTMRGDRLGVAGYQREGKSLTPRLDALAQQGAYFSHVYAQAPRTPGSVPSILTSRYPDQVALEGASTNYPTVLPENVMLPEVLAQAGIEPHWISSHFYFPPERGMSQGFAPENYSNAGAKSVKDSNPDIAAPRIVEAASAKLAQLAARKQRFAMFVHLFEPHSTYVQHEQFPIKTHTGKASLIEKYDYEIAFTDIWIGNLLDELTKQGLDKNTIVCVLSDHGEGFASHRIAGEALFFHGRSLYEEELRVPWIVYVPGGKPARVDTPVMLIDVAPTLLDILGVQRPKEFIGRTLTAALAGEAITPAPSFAHLASYGMWKHPAHMVVSADGRYKLIHRYSDNIWELFDLQEDPDEKRNLIDDKAEIASELKGLLASWKLSLQAK